MQKRLKEPHEWPVQISQYVSQFSFTCQGSKQATLSIDVQVGDEQRDIELTIQHQALPETWP